MIELNLTRPEHYQRAADLCTVLRPEQPTDAAYLEHYADIRPKDIATVHILLVDEKGKDRAFLYFYRHLSHSHPKAYRLAARFAEGDTEAFDAAKSTALRLISQYDAQVLTSDSFGDCPDGCRWLEEIGMVAEARHHVTQFNLESWTPKEISVEGYRLLTYADNKRENPKTYMRKWYELDDAICKTLPLVFEFKGTPYDLFEKEFEDPTLDLEGLVLAERDGELVGLSQLYQLSERPDVAETGLTGVLPQHRRKGLASAMKLKSIAWAKSKGVKRISTDNKDDNPMYQLNLQLGFAYLYDWLIYTRKP